MNERVGVEATPIHRSPEELFVEAAVQDALGAYNFLYHNPNAIVDATKGLPGRRHKAEALQTEELLSLGDKVTALAVLGGVYEDPITEVAKLSPAHNDHSAVALFRLGHKEEATRYLNDQLDMDAALPELSTLAGLNDPEAMGLVQTLVKGGEGAADQAKVFTALSEIIKTATNAGFLNMKFDELNMLVKGPSVRVAHGEQGREITNYAIGAICSYFMQAVYRENMDQELFVKVLAATNSMVRDQGRRKLTPFLHDQLIDVRTTAIERQHSLPEADVWRVRVQDEIRDELPQYQRPEIERLLDVLPYDATFYANVVGAYNKLPEADRKAYRLPMATALGKAGLFTEAQQYLHVLSPKDKILAAYDIGTYYYDQALRFKIEIAKTASETDPAVAAMIGQIGLGPDVDLSRLNVYEHIDRQRLDEVLAQIDAKIEVARNSSLGLFISPDLEDAKKQAMLELGSDRLRYQALLHLREEEQALAVQHMAIEPEDLPGYDAWIMAVKQSDYSWWRGLPATRTALKTADKK